MFVLVFSSGVDEFHWVMPTHSELSIRQKNARFIAVAYLFADDGRVSESFGKRLGGAGAVAIVVRFGRLLA